MMTIYCFQTLLLKNKNIVIIKIVMQKYKILELIVNIAMIDFVKSISFQKYMDVVTKHHYKQKFSLNSNINKNNVIINLNNIYIKKIMIMNST